MGEEVGRERQGGAPSIKGEACWRGRQESLGPLQQVPAPGTPLALVSPPPETSSRSVQHTCPHPMPPASLAEGPGSRGGCSQCLPLSMLGLHQPPTPPLPS